jgi:amidase
MARNVRDYALFLDAMTGQHPSDPLSLMKPEVIWNIERGLALTAGEIAAAARKRGALYHRAAAFFETYNLLLTPATIVPPFPVEQRTVADCEGQAFETYVDWLAIAYAITLTSCPAISIPCGFTRDGYLPVGLQLVGSPRGEAPLLAGALLMEQLLGLGPITPIEPNVAH